MQQFTFYNDLQVSSFKMHNMISRLKKSEGTLVCRWHVIKDLNLNLCQAMYTTMHSVQKDT